MKLAALSLSMWVGLLGSAALPAKDPPKGCPPYADGRTFDASPIVDALDTNKDGKLTHAEWQKAGAPEPSWKMFIGKPEIAKQGYITRAQFLAETPPNGIDANCDGKITLAEFLATKHMKMGPPPGAGAPPRGPGPPPPGARPPSKAPSAHEASPAH